MKIETLNKPKPQVVIHKIFSREGMARPSIPPRKPDKREVPLINDPFPEPVTQPQPARQPVAPGPIRPVILPREPAPIKR